MKKRHSWGKDIDDRNIKVDRKRGLRTYTVRHVKECVDCGLRRGYTRYDILYFDCNDKFLSFTKIPYTCDDMRDEFLLSEVDFLIL